MMNLVDKSIVCAVFFTTIIFSFSSCNKETTSNQNLNMALDDNFQLFSDSIETLIAGDNDSALLLIESLKKSVNTSGTLLQKVKLAELEGNYWGKVKSNYNKAMELFMSGVKICDENQLDYSKNLYHSLGVLFHITDNYPKAETYYTKAMQLSEQYRDTLLMVRCMVNLGSVNSSMEKFDEAEKFYEKSLRYPSTPYIRRATLVNTGNLKIRQKKYKEAIECLNSALGRDSLISGDDALDYSYLLNAKSAIHDLSGVEQLLPRCIAICGQCNDMRNKTILLKSIGDMYLAMNDLKQAVYYKERYILAYDSLKNQQRDEVVYEMDTKYQTHQKEEEIIKQQKSKTALIVLVIVFVLISGLLTYLVVSNLRQKKRLKKQTTLLETLIEEKNLLLRETHHRVKNSFQIVSGLLYLQSENIQDKDAAMAIKEAQNRVRSMVLIHQKLYNRDQLIGIETREYIEDLVNDIVDNQTDEILKLRTQTDVESVVFSIDTITPVGLIINELITNCIKHAFDESISNPMIQVMFRKEGDVYVLQVKDNGKGLNNHIKESSFGLKLIRALSKKLKAKFEIESNAGTCVRLIIHQFEEMN
jgi:two-component sensor histidine kinase